MRAGYFQRMLVESWLRRAARRRPDAIALRAEDGRLTYAELLAAATLAARRLSALGVRPGDRVAIALPARRAFAETLHGCLLLGAPAVPIDLRLTPAARRARSAGCAAVVDRPLDGLADAGAPIAGTHELAATAIVVHTSGTTHGPRPVELTYGNWLWSALGSAVALGVDRADVWLCALPLSHVGGLSILVRSAIYATGVVLHERFDADAAADELATRATLVSVVPTTLARLLDAGLRHPPRLRAALVGGAPIAPALLERAAAAGVPAVATYGLTEACSQVTTGGPPLFCTRVRIGAAREILVAGPTVAPGALAPDGWLHTGDEGALDADGNLVVTGRAGDTIISGGENVAPAEVEAVLESHPAVAEAAVHGAPDPRWGERVIATVVLRADHTATEEELRGHCRARLAGYKVPRVYRFSRELPRTVSGKLLRRSPQVAADDREARAGGEPGEGPAGATGTTATGTSATPRHEARSRQVHADLDPVEHRRTSLERWAGVAAGWGAHREVFQAAVAPVSSWLVDAIEPQPGHRVLELAAGPGDTGFLAAELIAPGGTLISSDVVEEMVDLARARSAELGISNVEFRTIDAEWIDLPTADVDGVLARWVYMLLADPAAALRETRRVLRPGGRVALSAWTDPQENPWASAPTAELVAMGAIEPPDLDDPNMFAFRDPRLIADLLAEAGFTDIVVEQIPIVFRYPSLDDWWDTQLDMSTSLARNVVALTPAQRDDLRDAIDARLREYVAGDG
ncbi:MAG TPA: AMP-binding protein, partial [Solirubrobacteraceae bacterium]|nr:AMP-binding protein [Solirubrobacteraceae bacterium]